MPPSSLGHSTGSGSTQTGALETEHRTHGDGAPCVRVVDRVRHDLRRGASAGAERDDRVPDPRQLTVHGPSDLVHGARRQIDDDETPEPRLVPAQRHPPAVGRHREGALAGTPRRAAVLVRFVEHRSALAVEREPSRGIREMEQRSIPAEARLLHLQRVATVRRVDTNGPAEAGSRDPALVPRHVRAVPLVPRHCRAVGAPRRVGAEVGSRGQQAGRGGARCGGIERRTPDLGHLHRVGDPPAVGRHRRRLQRTIGITSRGDDGAGRPADDVLPPQTPVAGGVDEPAAVRAPVVAPTAEPPTGAGLRLGRDESLRPAVHRYDDDPAAPAPRDGEAQRASVGRQPGFAELPSGDAHLRRDANDHGRRPYPSNNRWTRSRRCATVSADHQTKGGTHAADRPHHVRRARRFRLRSVTRAPLIPAASPARRSLTE